MFLSLMERILTLFLVSFQAPWKADWSRTIPSPSVRKGGGAYDGMIETESPSAFFIVAMRDGRSNFST